MEKKMNPKSPTSNADSAMDHRFRNDLHRLFYAHVGAVVLTAVVVVPLLLGITSIPAWVSAVYCVSIATVAFSFAIYAIAVVRNDKERSATQRIECLLVFLGLSLAQAVFVFPVLVCIYMPDLRL